MCASLTAEIRNVLRPAASGPTLLITIGNTLRSDDGAGPYIAGALGPAAGGCRVLDAADRPETILEPAVAAAPAKAVIIDAADFGGEPGDIRLIPRDRIPESALTTHAFPLPIIARLLEQDTGAEVHFLGIQPQTVAPGEGLTPAVRKSADAVIAFIRAQGESRHA